MQTVKELARHASPGGRPQPLAFLNGELWIGSWDAEKLYAVDAKAWSVLREVDPPGRPYGIAAVADSLFVVVALEDDNRYLYRFTPDRGFDESSKRPCPDFTGSHLASNGSELYLCQQGRQRILLIDQNAQLQREIALPTRCGGVAFDPSGRCVIISADQEFEELTLAQIDVSQSAPSAEPIAPLPFDGRGLAYDSNAWWSSAREIGEIVSFTVT